MIAKLIVWDRDREAATRRMLRALNEYEIEGLKTLLPFHRALLRTEQWANGVDVPRPDRRPRLAEGPPTSSRSAGRRRRPGGRTPASAARRGCVAELHRRAELRAGPASGCSSSTTMPRWRSCGSSIASRSVVDRPDAGVAPSSSASHSSRVRPENSSRQRGSAPRVELGLEEVLAADALAQLAPERRLERTDRDVAAVRALVQRVARVAAVEEFALDAGGRPSAKKAPRYHRLQRERAVGHGDVDVVALARPLRAHERGQQPGDAQQRATREVGDLHARNRRMVLHARGAQQARAPEVVDVVAGLAWHRGPSAPYPVSEHVDERRVDRAEGLVVRARAGPSRRAGSIRPARPRRRPAPTAPHAARVAQVQHDRALVAIGDPRERRRVADASARRPASGRRRRAARS